MDDYGKNSIENQHCMDPTKETTISTAISPPQIQASSSVSCNPPSFYREYSNSSILKNNTPSQNATLTNNTTFDERKDHSKPKKQTLHSTGQNGSKKSKKSIDTKRSTILSQYHQQQQQLVRSNNNTNYRYYHCFGNNNKSADFIYYDDPDRLIPTDEIALFMRNKRRYCPPNFRPIPPSAGGWNDVIPDRHVAWELTCENHTDFSPFLHIKPLDGPIELPWKQSSSSCSWSLNHRHQRGSDDTSAVSKNTLGLSSNNHRQSFQVDDSNLQSTTDTLPSSSSSSSFDSMKQQPSPPQSLDNTSSSSLSSDSSSIHSGQQFHSLHVQHQKMAIQQQQPQKQETEERVNIKDISNSLRIVTSSSPSKSSAINRKGLKPLSPLAINVIQPFENMTVTSHQQHLPSPQEMFIGINDNQNDPSIGHHRIDTPSQRNAWNHQTLQPLDRSYYSNEQQPQSYFKPPPLITTSTNDDNITDLHYNTSQEVSPLSTSSLFSPWAKPSTRDHPPFQRRTSSSSRDDEYRPTSSSSSPPPPLPASSSTSPPFSSSYYRTRSSSLGYIQTKPRLPPPPQKQHYHQEAMKSPTLWGYQPLLSPTSPSISSNVWPLSPGYPSSIKSVSSDEAVARSMRSKRSSTSDITSWQSLHHHHEQQQQYPYSSISNDLLLHRTGDINNSSIDMDDRSISILRVLDNDNSDSLLYPFLNKTIKKSNNTDNNNIMTAATPTIPNKTTIHHDNDNHQHHRLYYNFSDYVVVSDA
ncbi:uncharacterized protein BX664DRAFT_316142 [Halteromyces radiatus]|uniref:uncharacterized protein n=1 Tax=Halteromyces radiatus TaxID=101107 RepID=UPI00221F3E1F|nr:uncharacterized protein BX664DRAFT_316142 [Halteromyces radiatus]KAI8084598.1 hypothetical protein BX664DRAFT_316142 [Halteromyces radiatus]